MTNPDQSERLELRPAWWWSLHYWADRYSRLKLDHDALRAAHSLCKQDREHWRERVIELEREMGLRVD